MSAKVFLDTNVVVYAFDQRADEKRAKALELIAEKNWVVSWQVIQEFSHVALHRFAAPMKTADLKDFLELILWPRCEVLPSVRLYSAALELHEKTQYRFYDALMVASAAASGAEVFYSEDIQDGRKIGALTIRNPFRV